MSTSHVHKSRFGYHPCNMEVFLKLKELNKVFVDALHKKAAWERLERKKPHNRISRQRLRDSQGKVVGYDVPVPINEPALNGLLEKQMHFVFDRNGKYNSVKIIINFFLQFGLIAQEYKYARMPQPSENDVRQLRLSVEFLDSLLLIVRSNKAN